MKACLKVLPPPTGEVKIFGIDAIDPYMTWVEERIQAKEFSIALHSLEAIPPELIAHSLTILLCGLWTKWAMEGDKGVPPTASQRDVALAHVEALLADSEEEGQNDPNWLELHVALHRARHEYTLAIHYLNRWVECVDDAEELDRLSLLMNTIEVDRLLWEIPNPLSYASENEDAYLRALDTLEASERYREVVRSLESIEKSQRHYTLTLRLAQAWLGWANHELSAEKAFEDFVPEAIRRTLDYVSSIEAMGLTDPRWLEITALAFRAMDLEEAVNNILDRWEALGPDEDDRRRIMALRSDTVKRPTCRDRSK